MSKEAMKLALEALETERNNYQDWDEKDGAPEYIYEAITAVRQALEQPAKQEPWADKCRIDLVTAIHFLASDFENALGAFGSDTEARRKAEGDIAYARIVASRWNWNGTTEPAQQSAERVEPVDWEAVAADQAMTIALLKAEQPAQQQQPVCIGWDDKTDTPIMGYTSLQPAQREDWGPGPHEYHSLPEPEQPAQQEPVAKDNSNYRFDPPGLDPSHQKPVAWWIPKAKQFCLPSSDGTRPFAKAWEPLYTSPPQRTWVGLTQEELDEMFSKTLKGKKLVNWVARAIEAKLKEKNT